MQFTAGLVVILDLIGPDRLRRAGLRARERVASIRVQLIRKRAMPEQTPNGAVQFAIGLFLFAINMLLLILLINDWSLATRSLATSAPFIVAPVALLIYLVLGEPDKSAGARLPILGLAWLATVLLLGPPVAILDKANPGHILRWLGLLLFIAGFILDLLGS